jgi:hypothetical protein
VSHVGRGRMSDDMSLSERLAGFVPEDPADPPYAVPSQSAWPPDAHVPAWYHHAEADAALAQAAKADPSPTVAWAPAAPAAAATTATRPVRRPVAATPTRTVAATAPIPAWEWDDRRGMRAAVLVASATLLVGTAAAALILVKHDGSPSPSGTSPELALPAPLQAEVATIPPLDIGGGAPSARSAGVLGGGAPAEPAAVAPVTTPTTSAPTTKRPATTQKPPSSQGVSGPPPTLNPPNPPVKPTRPSYAATTTTKPAATTTSTTRPAPTTTTTSKPGNNNR